MGFLTQKNLLNGEEFAMLHESIKSYARTTFYKRVLVYLAGGREQYSHFVKD